VKSQSPTAIQTFEHLWKNSKSADEPNPQQFFAALHEWYNDTKYTRYQLSAYRGRNIYAEHVLNQNMVCMAYDRVHAMVLMEENDVYPYISTALEELRTSMDLTSSFPDILQKLDTYYSEDNTEGPELINCRVIQSKFHPISFYFRF
jgi:hypothetical protein